MSIDPGVVIGIVGTSALWYWAGKERCKSTHKQRGLETDLPEQVKVPDDLSGWSIEI